MTIAKNDITVAGRNVSFWRAGPPSGEPVLLVHGGRAGIAPIAAGAHLWDRAMPYLSMERPVLAIDLPGCGNSDLGDADMLSVDRLSAHVLAILDALSLANVHIVGHDFGGLIALWAALTAPAKLRSLSLVASGVCAPTGDALNDILFDALPGPAWSCSSQAWAFERVSYGNGHIDDALLSACATAAKGKPHGEAVRAMQEPSIRARNYGINACKGKIWAMLRTGGLQVPAQFVWSSHDPQASREAGYVLFKVIAEKQRAAQFHLINRAGSFPFREQPEEFGKIVSAFHDGIDVERAA